jgi:hypothetical protein
VRRCGQAWPVLPRTDLQAVLCPPSLRRLKSLPSPIEPAQLEAWRARLACGFPAVQAVLADCLLEARAALSPAGIDAYLDCANALGRMGRGAEPVLAFLQEWPSVARAVGEDLLNDVIALIQAMQKSPNSRAIAPLLQSLAAVARRLLGSGPMRDYLRVTRELMQRTTVSLHGHHATFESPGLPVFLEHAPRALDVLNVAGLSRAGPTTVRATTSTTRSASATTLPCNPPTAAPCCSANGMARCW